MFKNKNGYPLILDTVMNLDTLEGILLYSLAFNSSILLVWFGMFCFAQDSTYRLHSRWFNFSFQSFDALHYVGMSVYKIGIILLNIAPLVALWFVSYIQLISAIENKRKKEGQLI